LTGIGGFVTIESAITFFLAVLVFGVTPGPGVFAILARALVHGARSCFFLSLGMTISDILYLIAACLGLAAIATHWSHVFVVIRVVGALYLLYLGWRMWTMPLPEIDGSGFTGKKDSTALLFLQGFLISASNPKVILFYIAFLPTFMDLSVLDSTDIAIAAGLTLFSLMLGLSFIAWFAASARRYFESEAGHKSLHRSAGSIMMGAGAFLLFRS